MSRQDCLSRRLPGQRDNFESPLRSLIAAELLVGPVQILTAAAAARQVPMGDAPAVDIIDFRWRKRLADVPAQLRTR